MTARTDVPCELIASSSSFSFSFSSSSSSLLDVLDVLDVLDLGGSKGESPPHHLRLIGLNTQSLSFVQNPPLCLTWHSYDNACGSDSRQQRSAPQIRPIQSRPIHEEY